ncbi:MAG: hypothetical protein K5644_03185 [Lachnospiraceae bacterium]|nr:hypothetical protein [Lachnospiraceae bacterium]
MKYIKTGKFIVSCLIILSIGLLLCSCSKKSNTPDYNLEYNMNKFSKVDTNYIRNTGLFIKNFEITIPATVKDLPINSTGEYYFQFDKEDFFTNDTKIKPYQEFFFSGNASIDLSSLDKLGTYYAYNNTDKDNPAKFCVVYAVSINTRHLYDDRFIIIGEDRIINMNHYEEICDIFKKNVANKDLYIENISRNNTIYSVYEYQDILYEVAKVDDQTTITMRVDKDISDWK